MYKHESGRQERERRRKRKQEQKQERKEELELELELEMVRARTRWNKYLFGIRQMDDRWTDPDSCIYIYIGHRTNINRGNNQMTTSHIISGYVYIWTCLETCIWVDVMVWIQSI